MAVATHRISRKAPRTPAAPFGVAGGRTGGCTLLVMARQPVLGRVKTRLGAQIGGVEATRFYRNAVRTVVGRLRRDPRWCTVLAVAPDRAVNAACWVTLVGPGRLALVSQGRGDLGDRMQRLLAMPRAGPVILVGTDIPSIGPAHVAQALRLLHDHDAVLGPAEDGGFWLVGLKHGLKHGLGLPRRPFAGVRWSTPETLAETCDSLAGARIAFAATLSDVDTQADHARLGPVAARLIPPATVLPRMPATSATQP